MRLYLASSVFKSDNYDFLKTLSSAAGEGFGGVQLYLDPVKKRNAGLLERAAATARDRGLEIVAHLPDAAGGDYIPALLSLLCFQREKKAVVHYLPGRPIPSFGAVETGLENAVQGYDRDYYREFVRAASREGRFFAFDIPRLFGEGVAGLEELYDFIPEVISRMAGRDFIHLIDMKKPGGGREHWVPLGEGLLAPVLEGVKKFPGGIVLEYEDLGMALQSKETLLG